MDFTRLDRKARHSIEDQMQRRLLQMENREIMQLMQFFVSAQDVPYDDGD